MGADKIKEQTRAMRREGRRATAGFALACVLILAWGVFDLAVRGNAIGFVKVGVAAVMALWLWRSRSA